MRGLARQLTWVMVVSGLVAALSIAGCTGAPTLEEPVRPLRVSGSGTCLPLLRLLASRYPFPGVEFVFLPGLHTKGGVEGVAQGSLDIGAISRELTSEEQSAGLNVTWLSDDGLALAVHPSVARLGVVGLTSEQVRGIYSGRYTDWRQVGASESLPIVVLDRNEDESAKIILRKYVLGDEKSLPVTAEALRLFYETDMVEGVQSTPGSIGYFSLGYGVSQHVRAALVSLDGVEPTVANIESGAYKVIRPLGIVTPRSAPLAIREYLEWATSDEVREYMSDEGYAPAKR